MEATRDYPTKQSKSERERQIPYDITYVRNLNMAQANLSIKQKQTHSHIEQTDFQGGEDRGEGLGVQDQNM